MFWLCGQNHFYTFRLTKLRKTTRKKVGNAQKVVAEGALLHGFVERTAAAYPAGKAVDSHMRGCIGEVYHGKFLLAVTSDWSFFYCYADKLNMAGWQDVAGCFYKSLACAQELFTFAARNRHPSTHKVSNCPATSCHPAIFFSLVVHSEPWFIVQHKCGRCGKCGIWFS